MNKYFLITSQCSNQVGSAIAPINTKLDHELIPQLENLSELQFNFNLAKLSIIETGITINNDLSELKHIWNDYLPNSLAWPLFSVKLKDIILKHLTGDEGVNWIKARVDCNNEHRIYYIPRFEKVLDVLDTQKTIYVSETGFIIKPCFSLQKIKSFGLFHKPSQNDLWKITSSLYVNENIRKEIIKEKLTGIRFEKTNV